MTRMETPRFLWILMAVGLVPQAAIAVDREDDVAIPIIIIDVTASPDQAGIDQLANTIDAPTIRGPDLFGRLGLLAPIAPGFEEEITRRFNQAQDDFFTGAHEKAEAGFKDIIKRAHDTPNSLLNPSPVREVVFKAHIFLAILAHSEKDEPRVEDELRIAAERFLDLSPSPMEFPPWVREQFAAVRKSIGTRFGDIHLDAPADCDLVLSGQVLGPGEVFKDIKAGDYVAQVRCLDQLSPSQRLVVADKPITYRPMVLSNAALHVGDRDIFLETTGDATPSELIGNAVSIARSGQWERLIAIVSRPEGTELWLIDASRGIVLRQASVELADAASCRHASASLVRDLSDLQLASTRVRTNRPWFKDGLAWTLVAVGAAALGTGIFLGQHEDHGKKTKSEVWAWTLQTVGIGALGTGTILFFIPAPLVVTQDRPRDRPLAIGLVGSVSF
ncbi:MAG: hypothetical protein QNJ97_03440 [Myxococcota bacterium]|nr:hypothetical protein [Myxococcota bacterium]